jgi:hypothetical protein
MAEHTPPVPPRELRAQWTNDCPILSPGATGGPMLRIGTDWTGALNMAAAWGYEQAIPDSEPFILPALTDNGGVILGPAEREELAALLMELGQEVEEEADALCSGENIHPETESHAENLRELRDRARAAAERLRPTKEDS